MCVKTTIKPLAGSQQPQQTLPGLLRASVPQQLPKIQAKVMSQSLYLDQIQLELQQQQNALLSPRGGEK